MKLLLRYLGTVAAVVLTVYLVPGIEAPGGWETVFLVALAWSVIVTVIRPVLRLLALPVTILTFGLFSLVLNAVLFWLVAAIVPGFVIAGFIPAFFGALALSVIAGLIHLVL